MGCALEHPLHLGQIQWEARGDAGVRRLVLGEQQRGGDGVDTVPNETAGAAAGERFPNHRPLRQQPQTLPVIVALDVLAVSPVR